MKDTLDINLKQVLQSDGILIALVPPLGFRSEWGALSGYLKIAAGKALEIKRSELLFWDAAENVIEARRQAFGLGDKTKLAGPYSHRFSDDARRPAETATVRWRANDMEAGTRLTESEGVSLRVIYLPLVVSTEGDPHIIVTVVNRTDATLNIAEGVRSAACIVDGKRFSSNAGGHWDGGSHIQPKKSITKQFSLRDFPGVPLSGQHEMRFEILGFRSEPEIIEWTGMEAK